MKEYVITLIGVAIACGIIGALSPEGKSDGIKKHINLIMSLCVLCVMIPPLRGIISGIEEIDFDAFKDDFSKEEIVEKYDEIYKDNLGNYTAQSIARGAESMLCENFNLDENDVEIRVEVLCFDEKFDVQNAALIIFPGAISRDPHDMKKYISELLECECLIIYE